MPLYFFDCLDGGQVTDDPTGADCRTLVDAERLAIRAAADMVRDFSPTLGLQSIGIEIRDQSRRHLATVTLSLTTTRCNATMVVLQEGSSSETHEGGAHV